MDKDHEHFEQLMAEQRAKYALTLQCEAITKRGRRCKHTTTAWDYINDPAFAEGRPSDKPFTDSDWWTCTRHTPRCPHCRFASKEHVVIVLQRTLLWEPDVLEDPNDEVDRWPVGRVQRCQLCDCTWDPRMNLLSSGERCPVWGTGPTPGTFGELMFNKPEVLEAAFAYALEEERKQKRLQEWKSGVGDG
jgi:hypothetical protein